MEIKVDKSAIQAMITEILLKDKELSRDIFNALIKENPQFLEEIASASSLVSEPSGVYKAAKKAQEASEGDPNFPVLEDLTLERKKWLEENVNKHFIKYDDVFKALA